jgi:Protein of unknown function (DUF1460)
MRFGVERVFFITFSLYFAMNRNFYSILYIIIIAFAFSVSASALNPGHVRFHNEASDTTRINNILDKTLNSSATTPNERVAMIGEMFIGTPYVAHTLECDSIELLTVDLDELDCTTFVETVAALAITVGEKRSSWRDFIYNLERIRYRSGEMNGYSSRLHYICDWVTDNSYRGNVKDVTPNFPKVNYVVRSIDFMTANRDKYPALSDSATYAKIKAVEQGYRGHRYPFVKSLDLNDKYTKATLKSGDIVALTSVLKNLDVTHMGIVLVRDGEPYLLHASSSLGKVVITDEPLATFMKRNRQFTGVRVIRIED